MYQLVTFSLAQGCMYQIDFLCYPFSGSGGVFTLEVGVPIIIGPYRGWG